MCYHFRDEVANYLNDPNSPRFVVLKYLDDHQGVRLMVLKKEKMAKGLGEPLARRYDKKPTVVSLDEVNNGFPEKFSQNNIEIIQQNQPNPDGGSRYLAKEANDFNKVHSITRTFSEKPDKKYKVSFWVKAAGRDKFRFQLNDMYAKSGVILNVDVNNGEGSSQTEIFGKGEILNSRIEKKEFGWYRVLIEARVDEDSDKVTLQFIIGSNAENYKYNGNGSDGLLLSAFTIE